MYRYIYAMPHHPELNLLLSMINLVDMSCPHHPSSLGKSLCLCRSWRKKPAMLPALLFMYCKHKDPSCTANTKTLHVLQTQTQLCMYCKHKDPSCTANTDTTVHVLQTQRPFMYCKRRHKNCACTANTLTAHVPQTHTQTVHVLETQILFMYYEHRQRLQ